MSARHGVVLAGCALYSTHEPCADCARGIVQAGIVRVVYAEPLAARWAESVAAAREMFAEAGVEIVRIAPRCPGGEIAGELALRGLPRLTPEPCVHPDDLATACPCTPEAERTCRHNQSEDGCPIAVLREKKGEEHGVSPGTGGSSPRGLGSLLESWDPIRRRVIRHVLLTDQATTSDNGPWIARDPRQDLALLRRLLERCAQEADYEAASASLHHRRDPMPAAWAAKHIREIDVAAWLRAGCPDREPREPR